MILQTTLFVLEWLFAAIGIIGNIWVIVAITRYNAIKKTSNKIMFVNLAVADMGVLIVRNPFFFLLHYYNERWVFGDFACKIIMPFSLMFMPASLLTLVAISYSRYRAIVHVKKPNNISVRTTWYIVLFIWLFVGIVYPIVEIPVRRVNKTAESCDMDISSPVYYILYGFEDLYYMVSFLVMIVMFARMRRSLLRFFKVYNDMDVVKRMMKNLQALRLLWPVVIVLIVTIIPLMIGRIWHWIEADIPSLFLLVIDVLLVANSAVNPFIYIIVSSEFRQKWLKMHWIQRFTHMLRIKPHSRHLANEILHPYESNAVHESEV